MEAVQLLAQQAAYTHGSRAVHWPASRHEGPEVGPACVHPTSTL